MNYGYLRADFGLIKVTTSNKIKKIELVAEKDDREDQSDLTRLVIRELFEYLSKSRRDFSVIDRLDFNMSPFQEEVLRALLKIGYGEVSTYKDIAKNINRSKAYRAVGSAIGKNPFLIVVPCHRVIRSDGSLGGFFYGSRVKSHLLDLEKG